MQRFMTQHKCLTPQKADQARQDNMGLLQNFRGHAVNTVATNAHYRALESREVRRDDLIVIPLDTQTLPRDRTGRALVTFLNSQPVMEIWRVDDKMTDAWQMSRIGILDQTEKTGFRTGRDVVRQFRSTGEVVVLKQEMSEYVRQAAAESPPSQDCSGKRKFDDVVSDTGDTAMPLPKTESEFIVHTLDGQHMTCRTKNQGLQRVRDIEGMIRAMGLTRVQHILQDLLVMEGEFWRIVTRYKTDHDGQGGMPGMESMERVISICHLPVAQSSERLESFIKMKSWPNWDYGQWSLEDFLPSSWATPEWGKAASPEGKTTLVLAIGNFEKALTVFFNSAFEGCLQALEVFESRICVGHSDGYLRYLVEDLISEWHHDMNVNRSSWKYPDISMGTPQGCAEILKKGAEEISDRLNPVPKKSKCGPLEIPPHVRFFQEPGGKWWSIKNKESGKRTKFLASQSKGSTGRVLCAFELGNRLNLRNSDGGEMVCKWGDKCSAIHLPSGLTKEQMKGHIKKEEVKEWRMTPSQKRDILESLEIKAEEYM